MIGRCLRPIHRAAVPSLVQRVWVQPAVLCNLDTTAQKAFKATVAPDPDRPKRPLSAYMRFLADYRQRQGLKGGVDAAKKGGAAWKTATASDKAPFEKAYEQEREVYQKKFQEYTDSGKLAAWKTDPAQPKRPLTPYFTWATEQRKEPRFAGIKPTEVSKLLKPEWNMLPQAKKDMLQTTYKGEMETYKKKKAAYDASPEKTAWLEKTGRMDDIRKVEEKKAKEAEKKEAAKQKEAAKKAKEKEKAETAKEKLKMQKAKEKDKLAKEKEKAKLAKEKEREKKAKADAKAKEAKETAKTTTKKTMTPAVLA